MGTFKELERRLKRKVLALWRGSAFLTPLPLPVGNAERREGGKSRNRHLVAKANKAPCFLCSTVEKC